ncbi:MAG TPA: imidazolonepropionase [Candidatus Limnocylindria bacterium]|nr:imidazolonepropionase [Candidatus Limnocylindria bacterium]
MDGTTRLITGSGRLLTPAPYAGPLPWAIVVRDGAIEWVGACSEAPAADATLDLGAALVTPGLVDAHTHPVYAGDRSDEAAARLAGEAYTGGGILRTVAATRAATDVELAALVEERLSAQLAAGTTTVECKSGYGLSTAEEVRHLRIIGEVVARVPVRVMRTFLGAHAIPPDAGDYVATLVNEAIPAVAADGLAEFCDVFCDRGFFGVADAERILRAATEHGLRPRLHADQLASIGAVELATRIGAVSADHLEQLDSDGVERLARSGTVATLLPGPALVLRDRQAPARQLLDAGARVALASDANAGTFGTWGAMPLVIGLGATLLGMTALEAVEAATAGGAASLGLEGRRGRIAAGADADIVAWAADHEGAFVLRLGGLPPSMVMVGGEVVIGG